jgi:serine protease Do
MKRILLNYTRYLYAFAAVLVLTGQVQAREGLPDFTDLVKKSTPVVVNISTTQKVSRGGIGGLPPGMEIPELPEGSPFGELFRHFFGEDGNGRSRDYEARSLGSGVIISGDGYILTNYHVIKDAEEIIVRLDDRRELVAEMVGGDERSDIALLKIEASDLPVAKLGESEELMVGEWVLAIGSPFGFEHSATAGIVSAKGRALPNENYVPFIQTDVAINPGNSGGPLFNLDGEVVGINSQIYSRTGGYMGLSFAVPIEVAMDVADQLKSKGRVSRGWLGVLIQDVTRELAESFGMKRPMGALVSKVLPDSPAARAGVEVGDVIVSFAGREIVSSAKLPPIVGSTPIGKAVEMKVIREGKHKTLRVTLGELPEEEELQAVTPGQPEASSTKLGVTVGDLTDSQRKQLGIENGGVIVESVDEGSTAQSGGIREGDVFIMFDNTRIKNAQHFTELVEKAPAGTMVPLLVQREGGPIFLAVKVPD